MKRNVSCKRSNLIVGSHLNIPDIITANYDELSLKSSYGSHASKLFDLVLRLLQTTTMKIITHLRYECYIIIYHIHRK